jgi:hypothetical protein
MEMIPSAQCLLVMDVYRFSLYFYAAFYVSMIIVVTANGFMNVYHFTWIRDIGERV